MKKSENRALGHDSQMNNVCAHEQDMAWYRVAQAVVITSRAKIEYTCTFEIYVDDFCSVERRKSPVTDSLNTSVQHSLRWSSPSLDLNEMWRISSYRLGRMCPPLPQPWRTLSVISFICWCAFSISCNMLNQCVFTHSHFHTHYSFGFFFGSPLSKW